MEHARLSSLLVIALLQLSQTEISNKVPESWYAANVISDGAYTPRPLSELFPTEVIFSSTNPIVVLPTSPSTPNAAISTSTQSTTLGTITEGPSTEVSVLPLSNERPVQPLPEITVPSQPPPSPTIFIRTTNATLPPQPPSTPSVFISTTEATLPPQPPSTPSVFISTTEATLPPQPPSTPSVFISTTEATLPPQPPSIPSVSISTTEATLPPQPPSTPTVFISTTKSPQTLPPQAPQFPTLSEFQQPPAPPSPPIPSTPQQIQLPTAQQSLPFPLQQQQNLPPNYFLVYQQAPQNIQNSPLPQQVPSTLPPALPSTILPPSVTFPSTLGSVSTQAPCATVTPNSAPPANHHFPTFRIRMLTPSGSITNVRINANPTERTTTTRKPTTTRTRKRNRNNYDGCVSGCGGTRSPICASPLGVSPIDPDALKGFPSVCHMACHNSFRKTLYQKAADGKCSRLRTNIRDINATKLKKDDLNKATYTIVHDGAGVVEFSPLVQH